MTTFVIGDIHGEIDLLHQLLEKIPYTKEHQLLFLGDYIDRGPSAKAVLETIIALHQKGATCLMGNHEQIMLNHFKQPDETRFAHWVNVNGGKETLQSYGYDAAFIDAHHHVSAYSDETLHRHLRFIEKLLPYVECDDYIFVHGGVSSDVPLHETPLDTLLWIREEFHHGYNGDKTVVFGHTPTPYLHKEPENYAVYYGDNRIIGIDGGAVFGGKLHAIALPEKTVYSIQNPQKKASL